MIVLSDIPVKCISEYFSFLDLSLSFEILTPLCLFSINKTETVDLPIIKSKLISYEH